MTPLEVPASELSCLKWPFDWLPPNFLILAYIPTSHHVSLFTSVVILPSSNKSTFTCKGGS